MHRNKFAIALFVIIVIWLLSLGISKIMDISAKNESKIVILPIKGVILQESSDAFLISEESTSSTSTIKKLEAIEKDSSIKAVILEIDSPGGAVVASKEIAYKVKRMNKPVVSWIRESGASGAYWIASASDYIIADELSITGSIGVIGSYLEFSKLFDKYGIGYERLVSGDYKDTGSPYRKLTAEEQKIMQKKIDIIYEKFKQDVAYNRNISKEKINSIANGMFYIGSEAYGLGLVDSLGSKEEAINKAKELANIKEAKIVEVKEKKTIMDILSRISSKSFYYMGKGIGSIVAQDKLSISAM